MSNMRVRHEEEGSQMKESQTRAVEEVAKKHRVTLETALHNAEKEKNRLLAVSTHAHGGRAAHRAAAEARAQICGLSPRLELR